MGAVVVLTTVPLTSLTTRIDATSRGSIDESGVPLASRSWNLRVKVTPFEPTEGHTKKPDGASKAQSAALVAGAGRDAPMPRSANAAAPPVTCESAAFRSSCGVTGSPESQPAITARNANAERKRDLMEACP